VKTYEFEESQKKNILSGIDKLVKSMLKTDHASVGVQCDDLHVGHADMHHYSSVVVGAFPAGDVRVSQADSTPVHSMKESALSSDLALKFARAGNRGAEPYEGAVSPMEDYVNTKKLLVGAVDGDRYSILRQRLDKAFASVKVPADQQKTAPDSVYKWHVPRHVVNFLQNVLTETLPAFRLASWNEFKSVLHEFYDFRILHNGELTGAVNNYYVNFEESLLLFFLEKHKYRKTAELKLLEMLCSLKYYWEMWPRAKTFAVLTNLIKPIIQDINVAKGAPQLAILNLDIYLQEYFLHAYSVLAREKTSFFDSKDGYTYMKLVHEEPATQVLVTWFGEQENRKWYHKIRKVQKRYKATQEDEFETEFIDVDVLLDLYLEEYQAKRKQNLKDLQKEFMRYYQNRKEGVFSTDEIDKIVMQSMPSISGSAFVKYPGSFTIKRAYMYALTCKENTDCVNLVEFLSGCNRFGLDCPAPTVHKRLMLFGNDDDFEHVIKTQLDGYNVTQQARMHTVKQKLSNAIKVEPVPKLATDDSVRQFEGP